MQTRINPLYHACARALAIGAAAFALLPTAIRAQNIVVWQDDFDSALLGGSSANGFYGGSVAWNYQVPPVGNPVVTITNNNLQGTNTQNCAFTFDCSSGATLNFGLEINWLPATGNTNTFLSAYTLDFDIAIQGASFTNLGGYVAPLLGLFGNYGGMYSGDGAMTNPPNSFYPAAGAGYQHVSMPLSTFVAAHANLLPPTDTPLTFFMGFYMAGYTYRGIEEIDLLNVHLLMNTNPPPIPPPTMNLLPAKPGLRIFAQDHTYTYNQEGFGTVDTNQSWVGSTPSAPRSYSITFADFDTVDNYTLYTQFAPGAASGDPYGVYNDTNSLTWSITHMAAGFTTAITWKTNRPSMGETNNALSLTTTSTDGRGTWTLTFTNNTGGSVAAPDGTKGFFSLPTDMAALFADPVTILFGTAPNNTGGFGQYIDISTIRITNVAGINEFDDFTKDAALNTNLWNPGFSYNANPPSVIQVSTNTPYWVKWTVPDEGFGLGTKAILDGGTNWFSPGYYGSGVGIAPIGPTQMGISNKWVLLPSACLPTLDATTNGPVSPTGFFQLQKPPPNQ